MEDKITILDSNNQPLDCLTQWDVNRKLVLSGLNIDGAPISGVAPMIHFFTPESERALVVPTTIEEHNGIKCVAAPIPNILLQKGTSLIAFVFAQQASSDGSGEGQTVSKVRLPIIPKKKPEDYTFTENIEYANWIELSDQAQALIDEIHRMLDSGELVGPPGPQGPPGTGSGVHYGPEAPTNKDELWVDTDDGGAPAPSNSGMPSGGTAGQVLTKKTGADYDAEWKTPEGGGGGSTSAPVHKKLVDYVVPEDTTTLEFTDAAYPGLANCRILVMQFSRPSGCPDGALGSFSFYQDGHSVFSFGKLVYIWQKLKRHSLVVMMESAGHVSHSESYKDELPMGITAYPSFVVATNSVNIQVFAPYNAIQIGTTSTFKKDDHIIIYGG